MKRLIELKHVGPRQHVLHLLDDLIGRLEDRLSHYRADAVSLHVLFDENGTHKLYRIALTCHVPGHLVAAHEESRNAGTMIRRAFAELERQLDRLKATVRHEHALRRSRRTQRSVSTERAEPSED